MRRSLMKLQSLQKMKHFNYNHINLVPKKCIVNSRKECDTSITLSKGSKQFSFMNPVIPANMECIIDEEMAEKLASHNYFYIMHRFDVDILSFLTKMKEKGLYTSISMGVNEDSYELLQKMMDTDNIPDFITIDIAHGHCIKMEKILGFLQSHSCFDETFLIAGNVGATEGIEDLEKWGADIIKVGVGPGSACTTYHTTGFGTREIQASVVEDCAKVRRYPNTLLIADGGISEPADITKALALGANLVMVGGMFSGLQDSPGPTVSEPDGKLYKEFWGSASAHQSGKTSRIEGTKKLFPLQNKSMLEMMHYLQECLQSSISYGGGNKLSDLKNVEYICKK